MDGFLEKALEIYELISRGVSEEAQEKFLKIFMEEFLKQSVQVFLGKFPDEGKEFLNDFLKETFGNFGSRPWKIFLEELLQEVLRINFQGFRRNFLRRCCYRTARTSPGMISKTKNYG